MRILQRYKGENVMLGFCLVGFIIGGLLTGCAEVAELTDLTDIVDVGKSAANLAKSFQDFTEEQEYYVGRTVGAMILDKYPPYDNSSANAYINLLGQTLAKVSDRPETFAGYRFLILDSDDINAFAAPGGFIFVTRGMLRCAQHEDALAAILAHEIGHVQAKHGLQAIKKSRVSAALTSAALTGVQTYADEGLAELTDIFEDSIFDITTTLIENGYSRAFEKEADLAAIAILQRLGYNPNGLVDMLNIMDNRLEPDGQDFAKTHPDPTDRLTYIQRLIGSYQPVVPNNLRQQRFQAALSNI
jgi:predicted Zn-dependent protease